MEIKCNPKDAYRELIKDTDGIISRYINRKISVRITCFLINHNISISPNRITLITTITGLLSSILAYYYPVIGGLLIQIISIIDGVDGEYARKTNKTSKEGAFLDSLMDRIVDAAIIISYTLLLLKTNTILNQLYIVVLMELLLFSSLMVSYIHARGEASLGIKIQLLKPRIYIGRDLRLFLLALSFITIPFNLIASLIIIVVLTMLQLIYVFTKIIIVFIRRK
ncbi:MAG: CDP-alcohol phosphatidyltransferase family protein [Staphylothermus sp.]|nr:CDP-alcohol phosphatidyltransferase family protein [Staphylothermus sp.]